MNIRRMVESDREEYLTMARDFYQSPAVLHTVPDSYLECAFDELIRSDTYADGFLPIDDDGNCMGYALIAKTYSQESGGQTIWVEELYIKPPYRGMGVGTKLLAHIEEVHTECKRFRLEVEPGNEKAIELYFQLGYQEFCYKQMVKNVP